MANTENKNIEEKEKSETPEPDTKSETKTETASKKEKNKETNKKIEELQGSVKQLETKIDESKNDYLRLMAEFETYRRRTAEDRLNLVSSASADTIKGLLPVLDDCERAMAILSDSSDEAAKEGTELIFTKLMAFLKTKGLSVIEAKGEKFNVDFHEAVTQFPVADEAQKGMVIDVTQTGYILNGKVLRYAKVVVGA